MLSNINRMMEDHDSGNSAEDDLRAILEVVGTEAERRRVETTNRLRAVLRQVSSIHFDLEKTFNGRLIAAHSGPTILAEIGTTQLFWTRPGSSDPLVSTTCEAREAGDEIVIRTSGETIFRMPINSPSYGDEFQVAIRAWLLGKIREEISDLDASSRS